MDSWENTARFYQTQLMILSNEDITKIDEILKYSTSRCFNYLSWYKDKRTREMNALKKARQKQIRR